jgi:hypothetical protein
MHGRSLLFLGGLYVVLLVGSALAAGPADPTAPVPANRYSSIMSGTKSYRPVEPLPWGDVIRRVIPKAKPPQEQQAPQDKHKH